MTNALPEFPEYGSGGDYAGARRGRRAFRYGVAATIAFTAGLWLSEQYLRYEETERLYLLALTHEPEVGRVLLRQAIKIDAANQERPTAKYAAALAEREEDERRLAAYQKAYDLDPANAFLAMRFGCELFKHHETQRAHELFRAAYDHDPRNALPLYLEAATLPFIDENNRHLDEAFQLISRANAGTVPLFFQRPLWFSSLPQRGSWYARWRRGIARDLLGPINAFADLVFTLAEEDLARGNRVDWDARLKEMQSLGWRLLEDSQPETGTPQAETAILLQLRAVRYQIRFRELDNVNIAALAQAEDRLEEALGLVNSFETAREKRIAEQITLIRLPLLLIARGAALFAIMYLVVYAGTRLIRAGRQSWTLQHRAWAKLVLILGCLVLFMCLCLMALVTNIRSIRPVVEITSYIWFSMIGIMAVTGTFYPAFVLPLAHQVLRGHDADSKHTANALALARRARRVAYVSLMRRYYGILLGTYLTVVCAWMVGFRVLSGLYPWQIRLLTPGLAPEEEGVVRATLTLLGG